ncbi:MAG TPA: asparagine synthetase B [Bacteroidetes bacterium]|nr:asparagine synthetase B [Bacteroidota bacterium]
MLKQFLIIISVVFAFGKVSAEDHLLIPMDYSQSNHLKSYGIAYWVLEHQVDVVWLLNYKGGSFVFPAYPKFETELKIRGIKYERISAGQKASILAKVTSEDVNMDAVKLENAPKIAVYSPKNKQPWDDAVTLVLTYAEIPYEVVYDGDVLEEKLKKYDWLHLHHEDFTGQYGKFYASFRHQQWYKNQVSELEGIAQKYGFDKVSKLKLSVAAKIQTFCENGGFLFAMCSATDSYDIALAAYKTDICGNVFDGDPAAPDAQKQLDYAPTLAFEDFQLVMNPMIYEFSNIDANVRRRVPKALDYFTLFNFSAKWDPVPTMLCQNHTSTVKGFMGQTTAFNKSYIKKDVLIMGELKAFNEARYIHGNYGKGMWTFYGGHDPEDYQHLVGEEPTELKLYPNSPGYRLILNNILFPAARKKKQKT